MKSKQLFFFSEICDIKRIMKNIEEVKAIEYYEAGLFDTNTSFHLDSLLELEELGYVSNGDWNHSKNFLVIPKGQLINIREIPQRSGGVKYAFDQMKNPKSIVFKGSGILKDGVIVAGSIGTISEDELSLEIFRNFSKQLKKAFYKVGSFYVGPKAKEKLNKGWRLVTNANSPIQYDLKIE